MKVKGKIWNYIFSTFVFNILLYEFRWINVNAEPLSHTLSFLIYATVWSSDVVNTSVEKSGILVEQTEAAKFYPHYQTYYEINDVDYLVYGHVVLLYEWKWSNAIKQ